MRNEVIDLMQDLYFDERRARAVLVKIGFRLGMIPAFHDAMTFWTEVVLLLERGVVRDGIPFLVDAAAEEWPGDDRVAALRATVGGRTGPVIVLALFADPRPESKLRIHEEARLLTEIEAKGGITVHQRHAVRVSDIIPAITAVQPRILHFGGHGTRSGLLEFGGGPGRTVEVVPADLSHAIAAVSKETLDCVVLNCCYTGANVAAFRGATRAVAGSGAAITDKCAIEFAGGFYAAIGAGLPVPKAFEAGRAQAGLRRCPADALHMESFDLEVGGR